MSEGLAFRVKTDNEGHVISEVYGVISNKVYNELCIPAKLSIALGNSLIRSGTKLLREGEFKKVKGEL